MTPARRQYLELKARHPDAVLWFRLGDFYEMFDEDARLAAREFHLTLTSREFGKGERVPMAGVPHHAAHAYLARFLNKGYRVAICEQLSEPGRGLVERDVVRVVSPGTVVEPGLLPARANNYLAAVQRGPEGYGLAYVDVTTGEFATTQIEGADAAGALEAELHRLGPAELLLPSGQEAVLPRVGHPMPLEPWKFSAHAAREAIARHLGALSPESFGCADLPLALGAAGAVLHYLESTHRSLLQLLRGLRTYHLGQFMVIDAHTRRALELTHGARGGGGKHSLLWALDATRTPMGARLLRRMIGQPLLDRAAIEARLDAVQALLEAPLLRARALALLAETSDLERLAGRARQGIATPRDLLNLRAALLVVPRLREVVAGLPPLATLAARLDPCPHVVELIERGVSEEEGRLIKPGYSAELDGIVDGIAGARRWIAGLEKQEKERTGIRSLKVGYNKVFGYYIEVSRANVNAGLIPPDYQRKQTLTQAERYVTPALKEAEAQVLHAEERIAALEHELFTDLQAQIGASAPGLLETADALAHLDVFAGLAEVAARNRYCRPTLDEGRRILIEGGRHPVVEAAQGLEQFIANDTDLDAERCQIMLLTGPNMAGKSTYLRQVALIVLMAQIGSFVPARRARIGLVDRVFTRVGAQDDLAAGQSTFMVEMVETANILHHATARSLVVLDEIGRGTSTYDGLAIARAVLEELHDRIGARTLFATHYHELTRLADSLPRLRNYHVAAREEHGQVVFLHHVEPGGADRSYGIHVARLAGLPRRVTERAEAILRQLEAEARNGHAPVPRARRAARPSAYQLPLFGADPPDGAASAVIDELLTIDAASLTPREAITTLFELQQKARGRG